MKVLINFFAILLILIETHSILSENPTCAMYDFNDPTILNEFDDCLTLSGMSGSAPLTIESYSDSSFSPFRAESQYFLTTNKSVNFDITQCLSTKAQFRGNFSSFSFQIGINLRNTNETDVYNNVQLFVSNILAFQINPGTNGWRLYERNFSSSDFGTFENAVIGLKVRIGSNSELAVEFIKFYDPQINEDCVPYPSSTSPPENTTGAQITTDTLETETVELDITTPETEAPETETPTRETETDTTEAPETEPPETDSPEIEVPACFTVDFNKSSSLVDTFRECHGQYLPELIIKSYQETTITPYREKSLFYLSNKWEGLSCLETTSIFSLTGSNFIESVIFLNGVWPGAWIEISAVDIHTGEGEVIKRLQIENNWIRLSEQINGKFSNAQIIITTNMNSYSQLAMEFFNIRGDSC